MGLRAPSCTVVFLIQTTHTTLHSVIAKKNRRTITQNMLQVLGAGQKMVLKQISGSLDSHTRRCIHAERKDQQNYL
jgi:hypothetical protein